MKPSLNRTTIFKLIVHGIELHAAFETRAPRGTDRSPEYNEQLEKAPH